MIKPKIKQLYYSVNSINEMVFGYRMWYRKQTWMFHNRDLCFQWNYRYNKWIKFNVRNWNPPIMVELTNPSRSSLAAITNL